MVIFLRNPVDLIICLSQRIKCCGFSRVFCTFKKENQLLYLIKEFYSVGGVWLRFNVLNICSRYTESSSFRSRLWIEATAASSRSADEAGGAAPWETPLGLSEKPKPEAESESRVTNRRRFGRTGSRPGTTPRGLGKFDQRIAAQMSSIIPGPW